MRARGSSAPPTSHDKLSVKTLIETSFDREVKAKSDEPKAKVAEYPPKVENQPASCHTFESACVLVKGDARIHPVEMTQILRRTRAKKL